MSKYIVFEDELSWLTFRAKYFTSSKINKLLTEPKKKDDLLSVGAKTYVEERLSRTMAPIPDDFKSLSMERGNLTEPLAVKRVAQELNRNLEDDTFIYTSEGGFVFFYDDDYNLGATPDIIVYDEEMTVQIKCPDSKTHLKYLTLKTEEQIQTEIPDYYAQMQLELLLTGMKKSLFVSFDERFFNPELVYHSVLIKRNEPFIERIKDKALKGIAYTSEILKIINPK